MKILRSSINSDPPSNVDLTHTSSNIDFDTALGDIINIIVSYDMGWSKRGNGKSYNSLNGYGTIIGFLTGKVLDYATRNRKCKSCDLGIDKKNHNCRLNFEGSAKAMEADVGAALINNSPILKEVGCQVRVVIGDEDSSTMAAVRKENPLVIHKLADKNHLVKHFVSELYVLAKTFKQLNKKGVITHIKKCFTYAIEQNKGETAVLAKTLRTIPDHLYDRHENCGEWCNRASDSKTQTVKLVDEMLFNSLYDVFSKYANNASKFSVAASSQSNEVSTI